VSRRIAVLAVVFVAAACGGNPAPTPTSPSSLVTGSQVPGAATASPAASTAGGDLPAGVQFLKPAVSLPVGFGQPEIDFGGKPLYFGASQGALAMSTPSGSSWTTTPIDDGHSYAPPTGLPYLMKPGFNAATVVASKAGVVLAGTAMYSDVSAISAVRPTRESALWFSPDASHWTMFDPRSLLGGRGQSATISGVTAVSNGFLAAGSVAPDSNLNKPDIFVLRSSDGLNWTLASRWSATWSLESGTFMSFNGDLLLTGWEYPCTSDAGNHQLLSVGGQSRLWRSNDAGTTWTAVELSGAEPVMHVPNPPPADGSTCPKANDLQALDTQFASHGALLGVYDDRLVAISADEATISVTADLGSWHAASLPGHAPSGKILGTSIARLLTGGTDGWTFRSLEPRQDDTGQQVTPGYQVRWWRSTDLGASWTSGAPGKPLISGGAFVSLVPVADGSVDMVTVPTSASGLNAQTQIRTSVAGSLLDWTHCVAAPAADCSFATAVTVKPGTTDLRGVDLTAAVLSGASLPGVDLTGALLSNSSLDGNFAGANLSKTIISNGTLIGTFDGANLSGADLSFASLQGSMTTANFGGAFLDNATIGSKLVHASFKGADLHSAFVDGADLTGADMTGITADGITFYKDSVTCPDGRPSDSSATGLAACRIKP
jgi:uncharacterized protein YjbI with pentapeptide repeats